MLLFCGSAVEASGDAQLPSPHRHNPHVLLSLPSANVLGHYQYMLAGRFQYFNTSIPSADDSATLEQVTNMTYDSELLLGIENRAEVGITYGHALGLSIKALLVREDIFWPDLVFGVRNILGSPEAGLYAVEDQDLIQALLGESYFTLAKNFPSDSRMHFGLSYLSRAEKGNVGVNVGIEQDMGGGAYLGYEVFERFSDFHQVLSLHWRWKDFLGVSLGLTEFQSWIRQDGEWGFFYSPSKARPDGYNSPGITLNLQISGHMPRRQKRTLPERVAIMEVRNAELERRLGEMQEALIRSEARVMDAPCGPCGESEGEAGSADLRVREKVRALLQSAADRMAEEITDAEGVRKIMYTVVTLGPAAAEALRLTAQDTGAGAQRIPALLTMAFSRDASHGPALRALFGDKDATIRREALNALTKVQPESALEDARRLLQDPDETVAMAAGEAYRMLGGDPGAVGATRTEPARPGSKAPAKAPAKSAPKPSARR